MHRISTNIIYTMNLKRYIKVTPCGEQQAIILLATNRDFYLSQNAQVEQPTEEEVLAAFPELQEKHDRKQAQAQAAEREQYIATLEQEIAALKAENTKLKAPKTTQKKSKTK